MHVDHNWYCIRDGDAFRYEDILHLLTLTQTFHFTLTYNVHQTNLVCAITCLNEWTTINAGKVWLHVENCKLLILCIKYIFHPSWWFFFYSVSLLHQKDDTFMIGETKIYRKYTHADIFFSNFFKDLCLRFVQW